MKEGSKRSGSLLEQNFGARHQNKITLTKVFRTERLTAEISVFENLRCAFTYDDSVRCGYAVPWGVRASSISGHPRVRVTRCYRVRVPHENGCALLSSHLTTGKTERTLCLQNTKYICNNEASKTVGTYNDKYAAWLKVEEI